MRLRIGLLTFGSRGDIQPFLALARELMAGGAEVILAGHEEYRGVADRSSVAFRPLAGDPREWMRWQAVLRAHAGRPSFPRVAREFVQSQRPDMRLMLGQSAALAETVDALVFSHGALAGPHLVEASGMPAAFATLQPWQPTAEHPSVVFTQRRALPDPLARAWNRVTHPLGEHITWQPWRGVVNEWRREELGLPAVPAWRSPWRRLDSDVLHLCGYSAHLAPPPADWRRRAFVTGFWRLPLEEDFTPPTRLERFLAAGPAPVYVGFGSSVPAESSRRVLEAVTGAVRTLGLRAVVSAGWARLHAAEEPRDGLLAIDDVAHEWLFPRVSAVVHHAGAGTTAAALRAGVPQVPVPDFFDQFFWAERARRAGVAPEPLRFARLDAALLARALEFALSDRARERARELGAMVRAEGGARQAAELLLDHFRYALAR